VETIEALKPTILIGVSTRGGAFNRRALWLYVLQVAAPTAAKHPALDRQSAIGGGLAIAATL
jgi:hypothetical protein